MGLGIYFSRCINLMKPKVSGGARLPARHCFTGSGIKATSHVLPVLFKTFVAGVGSGCAAMFILLMGEVRVVVDKLTSLLESLLRKLEALEAFIDKMMGLFEWESLESWHFKGLTFTLYMCAILLAQKVLFNLWNVGKIQTRNAGEGVAEGEDATQAGSWLGFVVSIVGVGMVGVLATLGSYHFKSK